METKGARAARLGTIAAFATYALWGVFPLYWKRLAGVDSLQILCHRIVWAAAFTLLILAVQGKLGRLVALIRDRRKLRAVLASAALITVNWGIYIWAVNAGRVTESSLGYYINPLLSVALGAIFLGERLDRWTARAVATAAAGIAAASILLGSLPWVSLVLASSFALYGLVKKVTALDPMTGLAAETLAATPFALAWLAREHLAGRGSFGGPDATATAMLLLAGVVTAVPLLLFAFATNRISLTRIGFIQYLSPSIQLALGLLVYGERLKPPLALAFGSVVLAVGMYALTRRADSSARNDRP